MGSLFGFWFGMFALILTIRNGDEHRGLLSSVLVMKNLITRFRGTVASVARTPHESAALATQAADILTCHLARCKVMSKSGMCTMGGRAVPYIHGKRDPKPLNP